MQKDIILIVSRQLDNAQDNHARALRVVERIQRVLDNKIRFLEIAQIRLANIEEIHNAITQD
jgi:hypothetical protein